MSRKPASGTIKEEISQARANLDHLLRAITENKGVSPLNSDDESDFKINDVRSVTDQQELSPRKKSASHGGKRRKKAGQDLAKATQSSTTYVAKLFDRSIDLAPYEEGASLYPICRAWLINSSGDQPIEQLSAPRPATGGEAQFPAPYMIDGSESLSKLRIPEPIVRKGKPLDIYASDEDATKLLVDHIAHWRRVKESWRDAGRKYEARFATSHAIIKQMYDSAPK